MNQNNLFDNPMVNSARKSMSKEQLEDYRIKGESMFKNIDFENASINNMPPMMSDAIYYLEEIIKSGMHISMLEESEKKLLEEVYGEEWYKHFGYVKEDVNEIYTIKKE